MLVLAIKLVAVAGVLSAVVVMLARMAGTRGGRSANVRVQARHGLSRTAMVAVVEVDGRRFLVGAGDGTVSMLTELDPQPVESVDDVAATAAPPTAGGFGIGPWLAAAYRHSRSLPLAAHGTGTPTTPGPRIGPLDRLRRLTVRTQDRPIHAKQIT